MKAAQAAIEDAVLGLFDAKVAAPVDPDVPAQSVWEAAASDQIQ